MTNSNSAEMNRSEDFFYLQKYGNRKHYQIPSCFGKCNFKQGERFRFRVTHIYDPSKFWIVVKYRELELFQKYLFKWYYINRNDYKVPENEIVKDMYCVVFIDGGYYRGVVVGFSCGMEEVHELHVYFIDYGMVRVVVCDNIYYMNRKCMEVPQFVVRVTLAGICPRIGQQWTNEDVTEFHQIVCDKILVGIIINVDCDRQVLEIHFSEEINGISSIPVHKLLMAQNRARYFNDDPKVVDDKAQLQPKLKYAYLFPSHEALETGKVPLTISDAEFRVQVATLSSIMSRYYKSKQNSDD